MAETFLKFQPASKFGAQTVHTADRQSFSYGVSVYQTLFDFGKSISGWQAAKEGAQAYRAHTESVKRIAELEFITVYFNLLETEKMIVVFEKEVESLEAYLRDIEHLYEQGMAVASDLLPAKVKLADTRQKLISVRNGRQLAVATLNAILALPLSEETTIVDIKMMPPDLPLLEEAWKFIFVELRTKDPVLNIRQLKNVSFASANVIQSIAFFGLFGSIVLLPLFVQQLLGYNAFLAGMVIAPGGVTTVLIMPIVGKLVTRINPKSILFCGLLLLSYSMFMMSRFNLLIDYNTVLWSRIVMGLGMGMIFIPLTTMAFTDIKKEEMGNATSIFNLLRNISGSFGIAFMTTVLARRAQFHQLRFSERLNPFDPHYQIILQRAPDQAIAHGMMYRQLIRQANLFSFTDAFYVAGIIILCVLPFVFLLRRPQKTGPPAMAH